MTMVKNFEEFLRESYGGEVSESLILEHRNDLKPIICIIIGGSGRGQDILDATPSRCVFVATVQATRH